MKRWGLLLYVLLLFFMVACSSGSYVGTAYSSYPYAYDYYPNAYGYDYNYSYSPYWYDNGFYTPYSSPYNYGWSYYPYNYRYYHNYDRSMDEMW